MVLSRQGFALSALRNEIGSSIHHPLLHSEGTIATLFAGLARLHKLKAS